MTVTLRTARAHRICDTYGPPAHPILPGELYTRHVTFPGQECNEDGTKPIVHEECAWCADERGGKWIRERYGVPAYLGRRVVFDGVPGRIVGFSGGGLWLRFGAKHVAATHPTWNLTYLEAS